MTPARIDGRPRFCFICRPELRTDHRRWRAYITDQKPPEHQEEK